MNRIEPWKFGFLRVTLAACVGIPLIIASNAFAQNLQPLSTDIGAAPTPTAAEAQRVIVTGSNIPTAEEVGPNPVDIYNRENINKSGEFTTEQFLLSLPITNANVVPTSNNENGSNTAVGAATIALRGFDARATLILLDGRRVAVYPTGNNPGLVNVMFVDLNSIPQAAIESIEILKDGASTTYGADAVAGVVNLKMRHTYDGAEARIQYGNTLDKDSGELDASAIFGVGNKDTNITGVLNYYHRNAIANRDRGFSLTPPFLSSNNSPYNLQLSSDVRGSRWWQEFKSWWDGIRVCTRFYERACPRQTDISTMLTPVSGRPAVFVPALISICSRSPCRNQSAMEHGSVVTIRSLAIRWSSMRTAFIRG